MQVSLALHIYYFKVPSLSGVKKGKHKKEDKQGKYFDCFFFLFEYEIEHLVF